MLENPNSYFAPKEHQEINIDVFFDKLKTTNLECKEVNRIEKISKKYDEKEVSICENFFNNKIDYDLCLSQLNVKQQESEEANKYEVKGNISENSEKEKTLKYSKLADLSYIHLKTNPNQVGNESFEFQTVSLDPTSFEHIATIFDNPNFATLTEDEIFLYNYINENKNTEPNYEVAGNREIENILEMVGLDRQLLASNIGAEGVYDGSKAIKYLLLSMGLHKLVEKKEQEAQQNFENLKQDYEILDYFPNESKGDKDSSGFGAVFLEKEGRKFIAIRGTEGLNDWKDLYADGKIALGNAPGKQMKAMIDFIDRCILPGEKFSIVGHSLGGALSQILTAMYVDQIKETYTFSSPGAKKLDVADDDLQEFAKFRDFVHNRDRKKVGELITNVVGKKGFAPISNLGVDIGLNEIHLKNLRSHSITATSEYIDKLPSDSPELIKKKVKIMQIKDIKFKR